MSTPSDDAEWQTPEQIQLLLDRANATIEQLTQERDELRESVRSVRDTLQKRSVHRFDYEGGEYPVDAETITLLVLEKAELQPKADAFDVLKGDMPSGWSLKDIQQMCAGWAKTYEREGSFSVNETEVFGLMKAVATTLEPVLTAIQQAEGEK